MMYEVRVQAIWRPQKLYNDIVVGDTESSLVVRLAQVHDDKSNVLLVPLLVGITGHAAQGCSGGRWRSFGRRF